MDGKELDLVKVSTWRVSETATSVPSSGQAV